MASITRRIATLVMAFALLLGAGSASCWAAIESARALQCCSKDCPTPAHNPDECCSVRTSAQDGEVAPALHLNNPDSFAVSFATVPVSAIFAPSSASSLAMHLAHWSPPPRLIRSALCSLQI
jgi:hypothetical protein